MVIDKKISLILFLVAVFVVGGLWWNAIKSNSYLIASAEGSAQLTIPKDSLPEGVSPGDISIVKSQDSETGVVSYALEPDGIEFRKPVTFRAEEELKEGDGIPLVAHVSAQGVDFLDNVTYMIDGSSISLDVSITHFSKLVILGSYHFVISAHAADTQVGDMVDTYASIDFSEFNPGERYLIEPKRGDYIDVGGIWGQINRRLRYNQNIASSMKIEGAVAQIHSARVNPFMSGFYGDSDVLVFDNASGDAIKDRPARSGLEEGITEFSPKDFTCVAKTPDHEANNEVGYEQLFYSFAFEYEVDEFVFDVSSQDEIDDDYYNPPKPERKTKHGGVFIKTNKFRCVEPDLDLDDFISKPSDPSDHDYSETYDEPLDDSDSGEQIDEIEKELADDNTAGNSCEFAVKRVLDEYVGWFDPPLTFSSNGAVFLNGPHGCFSEETFQQTHVDQVIKGVADPSIKTMCPSLKHVSSELIQLGGSGKSASCESKTVFGF